MSTGRNARSTAYTDFSTFTCHVRLIFYLVYVICRTLILNIEEKKNNKNSNGSNGTLSHGMCLKSHWISETKKNLFLTEEQIMSTFWAKFNFYFCSFPSGRTLKFLKMKCNPTNKYEYN